MPGSRGSADRMSGDHIVKGVADESIRQGEMVIAELGRVHRAKGSADSRRPDVYLAVAGEAIEKGDYVEFAHEHGGIRARRQRG